jgi:hypothetical protein
VVTRVPAYPGLNQAGPGGGITSAFGIAAGAGLAGGGDLTQTVTVSMAASGVVAGTYGDATTVPQITFNDRGQASTVSSVAIAFPASGGGTAIIGLSASNQFTVGGSPVTGTGTLTISLQTSTVTAGTYGNATQVAQFAVNAQGQLTSASSISITFPANTHIIQDEGSIVGTVTVLNFAGAGVTVVATGATAAITVAGAAGSDPWTYTVLASPFSTTSVVPQPSGLFFAPAASTKYEFEFQLSTRTSDVTVGPRPALAWATGLTDGVVSMQQVTSATGINMVFGNIGATVTIAVGALPSNSASWPALGWGFAVAGAGPGGSIVVQLASEIATSRTVSIQAGSFIKWRAYS